MRPRPVSAFGALRRPFLPRLAVTRQAPWGSRTRRSHSTLLTLAIETSCDDTAVALLEVGTHRDKPVRARLLFNKKITSNNTKYHGVHPLASLYSHQQKLATLVDEAIRHLPKHASAFSASGAPPGNGPASYHKATIQDLRKRDELLTRIALRYHHLKKFDHGVVPQHIDNLIVGEEEDMLDELVAELRSHLDPSASSPSPEPVEDWTTTSEPVQRARIQSRLTTEPLCHSLTPWEAESVPVLQNARESRLSMFWTRIPDFICVTRGPGMRSNLFCGIDTAKGLATAWGIPLVGVHHMQAHALTPRLVSALHNSQHAPLAAPTSDLSPHRVEPAFPFLSVLASGGHTLLILSSSLTDHGLLATTTDIAIGDFLDKTARRVLPPHMLASAKTTMYGALLEEFAFPRRDNAAVKSAPRSEALPQGPPAPLPEALPQDTPESIPEAFQQGPSPSSDSLETTDTADPHPHLCYVPSCPRSQPEHAFRTRKVMIQHMRVAHNYRGNDRDRPEDLLLQTMIAQDSKAKAPESLNDATPNVCLLPSCPRSLPERAFQDREAMLRHMRKRHKVKVSNFTIAKPRTWRSLSSLPETSASRGRIASHKPPYLCYFPSCSRSTPEGAFATRRLLRQHLRRRHGFKVSQHVLPSTAGPNPIELPMSTEPPLRSIPDRQPHPGTTHNDTDERSHTPSSTATITALEYATLHASRYPDYEVPKNREVALERNKTKWGWALNSPLARAGGGSKEKSMEMSFSGLSSAVERVANFSWDRETGKPTTPRGEDELGLEERRLIAREAMRAAFEHLGSRVWLAFKQMQQMQQTQQTQQTPFEETTKATLEPKTEPRADKVPETLTTAPRTTPDASQEPEHEPDQPKLVLSGGVAANSFLRYILASMLVAHGFPHTELYFPPIELCTDNAAMIAWAGAEMYQAGHVDAAQGKTFRAVRKWSLERLMDPPEDDAL